MLGRRRNPRPILERRRPGRDRTGSGSRCSAGWYTTTFAPLTRLQALRPAGHRLVEARQEGLAVLLERRPGCSGAKRARPSTMFWVIDRRQAGIERVVRIAQGMHVAHRAVDSGRRAPRAPGCPATTSIRPGRAADDVRVVRALDGDVGPRIELERRSRSRRSARRSFSIRLGRTSASWKFWVPRVERLDLDQIAADLLGERLEVGDRGDDPDLVGRRARPGPAGPHRRPGPGQRVRCASHGDRLLEGVRWVGAQDERWPGRRPRPPSGRCRRSG